MSELLVVNHPAFYRERSQRPQTFEQFVAMVLASREHKGKPKGIWELSQVDPRTGRVKKRIWNMNVVTDNGAYQLLQRGCNSSSATLPNLFNNLLLTNNSGSTTLTSGLTNSSNYTSLPVSALPAAIPSGSTLQIGFGTGQTQNVTTSASAAQGATSVSASFTANASYSAGTNVVPVPQTTDNPSSVQLTANASSPLTSYSGNLATGAFTYTQGVGPGDRTVLVQFTFANGTNGGSASNGSYTDCWIVNVSSGATTGDYLAHEINTPMTVNNSNNILAKATVGI